MSNMLIVPLVVPLTTAAFCLMGWTNLLLQRWLSLIGAATHLAACVLLFAQVQSQGIMTLQAGDWPAPFGITFVADRLSSLMLVLAGVVGFAVVVHSLSSIERDRVAFGYYPLVQVLMLGVTGAFLTGDMFNLFVWFEVLLISSFVLMALGGDKPQLQGAFKYVAINLVASAIFLSALGLLYGTTGTLNMAHLAQIVDSSPDRGFVTVLAMMFLVSFGIKAGLFPFFFWLPASYHTPPTAVAGLFAGLLTKVGVYALLRVFSLIFIRDAFILQWTLVWLSALTMLVGAIGAMVQTDLRRVFAFNMLVGIGSMVFGIGLATEHGFGATILYMIHSAIATSALFFFAGLLRDRTGTYDITKMGGLYRVAPVLSLGYLASALAVAGIPPFSGFFPKLALLEAGITRGAYGATAVLLIASLLALASVIRVWNWAVWRSGEPVGIIRRDYATLSTVALCAATLLIPVFAAPLVRVSQSAGISLVHRWDYVESVLQRKVVP